jgi:glycosyltransferase involved in cell wall biosynthesis
MAAPGAYEVSRPNAWAFWLLDKLADANILIAEAGEPNLRKYMPTIPLPVVANSVIVDDMEVTSAVHEPPVILFVGELLERKGVVVLLDALDLIDARGDIDYRAVIVGDNRPGLQSDKDKMVAEITRRGRADCMTGPLPREGVYDWLSKADIYVTPTLTEGQPFTVIEALAAGVPIVGSDIQALTNMISDPEHGRLLRWDDSKGFAEAMIDLLSNPDERREISVRNRELAYRRFDRSVFSSELAALYRHYGSTD